MVQPAQPCVPQQSHFASKTQRGTKTAKDLLNQIAKEAQQNAETPARTTIMLRNLPKDLTRAMCVEMLNAEGFHAQFDFVYVPADYKHHVSFGYAFVNFKSHELATQCIQHFEGFQRWCVESDKVCAASWSDPHQGLEAHIERFRNSPVMHPDVPEEYRPMILVNGTPVPFPAPTMQIRAPPARRRITARTRAVLMDA